MIWPSSSVGVRDILRNVVVEEGGFLCGLTPGLIL